MGTPLNLEKRRSFLEYLSTVRLTIVVCIALAATSVIGTLIPQNQSFDYYLTRFGIRPAGVLKTLGFFDLYHSPLFVGLLCLLALNLVFCTCRRFPNVWRSLTRDPHVPLVEHIEKWKHVAKIPLSTDLPTAKEVLSKAIQKIFGNPRIQDADGIVFYGVQRGRWARVGPYVTHASILLILIGALVGSLFGFKGFVTIQEGSQVDSVQIGSSGRVRPLGFTIHCTRFSITNYPNGTPKEYRSEITIKDTEGRVVLEGPVRVNHPVTYNGITLYQSTYGMNPEVTLSVRDTTTGKVTTITTALNTSFEISSHNGVRAMLLNFDPDAKMPLEMARLLQRPRQGLGPAAQIVLLKDQGPQDVFWIFKEYPEFNKERLGSYSFEINDYVMRTYTGLQVVKDPGTTVIWIGCVLMVIGFVLSFFFEHHVVWVVYRHDRGRARGEVIVAGRGLRHPGSYGDRFTTLLRAFEKELSPHVQSVAVTPERRRGR